MGKSQDLYRYAKKIIPGGTQLLSKRPEMFLPDIWPAYYEKAEGCSLWDIDGNHYYDMSYMGLGSCILGYSDKDINDEIKKVIDKGNLTTLNAPEEVELFKIMKNIHPWADMARYARTGGEAMSIAVRIARARTGKDLILFCGYHGWHDWYLSANISDDKSLDGHLLSGLEPAGVPRALNGTAIPFNYNDTNKFLELIDINKKNIAAVVMEPIRNFWPDKNFLKTIRDITTSKGIILIYDEITAGWRLNIGGAHLLFGIEPDIAVFAKGISNGFPMAAIIGKQDVMEAAQKSFISSTYWTDRLGPAAAIATINKMTANDVPEYLKKVGEKIQKGWKNAAQKVGLKITISGISPLSHFSFDYENHLVIKTLFTQSMLEKGFLATNAFYSSFAHNEEHINKYLIEVEETFNFLVQAIQGGKPDKYLKGPACHAGFRRLT